VRSLFAVVMLVVACAPVVSATPTPIPSGAATATAIPSTGRPATASPAAIPGRSLGAAEAQQLVGGRVASTLDALKRRDSPGLAALAHPTKGVRFSPYSFVNFSRDVVLTRQELANIYADTKTRVWGVTDGKGDDIVGTFSDYSRQYVWSRDFIAAPKTAYNKTIGSGNTTDNTAQVHPDAILFEAYDPGPDPAMESVQWQCLRLLFEADGGTWYLVGVVHGQWTI
jgi:hypothetical protein